MSKIISFTGQYRFLSNFWPCEIQMGGELYPSVEHAYQAAKTLYEDERDLIRKAGTPGEAKRLGKKVTLRTDWEYIKLEVMGILLSRKFSYADLQQMLLSTGDSELIEGNTWGDIYWGVCEGRGLNHLGKLLMEIREKIRREDCV